jgi:filamentous hemagglutinin
VAHNAVENNALTRDTVADVKACLKGETCSTDQQKKEALERAKALSKMLDDEMNALCKKDPTGDACRGAVSLATQYAAMIDPWDILYDDVVRSTRNLFDYVFNGSNAKWLFSIYYRGIDNRADFFGAMNQYEQHLGSGTQWFGGAEQVSRAAWTGLGADGNGSRYTFFAGAVFFTGPYAYSMYEWRSEAGNSLMNAGFESFRDLYNNGTYDAIAWDINQLRSEQQLLQPIHVKYLENRSVFRFVSKQITGVDLLDYNSRVQYGCELLGYSAGQGCKP